MTAEEFIKSSTSIDIKKEKLSKHNNLKFVIKKYNQFNHYNKNIKLLVK